MSKSTTRKIVESISDSLYKLYSTTDRIWNYQGLNITVLPKVFHPGWFVTSRMLLDHLETTDIEGRKVLELGCGTGALACRAAAKGAESFACDITNVACQNAILNSSNNNLNVRVFQSDIFDQIDPTLKFDLIYVNPPFIAKYPEEERDFAFFCGEQYEYYEYLFRDLDSRLENGGQLIMALSKSCDAAVITEIAKAYGFDLIRIFKLKKWAETNYLFSVTR